MVNGSAYKQLEGKLIHLIATTPILTFVVDYISGFLIVPKADHWMDAKRNLKYVNGILKFCIMYGRKEDFGLLSYIDLDKVQLITGTPPQGRFSASIQV